MLRSRDMVMKMSFRSRVRLNKRTKRVLSITYHLRGSQSITLCLLLSLIVLAQKFLRSKMPKFPRGKVTSLMVLTVGLEVAKKKGDDLDGVGLEVADKQEAELESAGQEVAGEQHGKLESVGLKDAELDSAGLELIKNKDAELKRSVDSQTADITM